MEVKKNIEDLIYQLQVVVKDKPTPSNKNKLDAAKSLLPYLDRNIVWSIVYEWLN